MIWNYILLFIVIVGGFIAAYAIVWMFLLFVFKKDILKLTPIKTARRKHKESGIDLPFTD